MHDSNGQVSSTQCHPLSTCRPIFCSPFCASLRRFAQLLSASFSPLALRSSRVVSSANSTRRLSIRSQIEKGDQLPAVGFCRAAPASASSSSSRCRQLAPCAIEFQLCATLNPSATAVGSNRRVETASLAQQQRTSASGRRCIGCAGAAPTGG